LQLVHSATSMIMFHFFIRLLSLAFCKNLGVIIREGG
jgi:hypothetical protein